MKVKLGKKGTQYVPKNVQPDYNCDWIGIVDYKGRKGALTFNRFTGQYVQHFSPKDHMVLDYGEVLQAIADASKPIRSKPVTELMRPKIINLTDKQVEYVRSIGEGNMAEGVRRCIDFCIINKFE